MKFRSSLVVTLALIALIVPLSASAQGSGETLLLVGVQRAGKVDPKLSRALYDYLTKHGESLLKDNVLAPPERLCTNDECLGQLTSREGAQVAIVGQIQEGSPTSLYLTMRLFDDERRQSLEERSICEKCTAQQLSGAIFDLSDRLLRTYRDKKAASNAPPPPVATAPTAPANAGASPVGTPPTPDLSPAGAAAPTAAPPPAAAPLTIERSAPSTGSDFFGRWSRQRRIAAGVLSGLLVAALIPSVALQATDGTETTLIGCTSAANYCVLQNKPFYITGYAVSGALAVGLAITFLLPTSKPAAAAQSAGTVTEGK